MDVGTTEMAVIGAAVVGGYKALDGAIAIIKILITKNGKDKPTDIQPILEERVIHILDSKTDNKVCEERHKNVDEKFGVIFEKLDKILSAVRNGG
jgi:hypothetical protein